MKFDSLKTNKKLTIILAIAIVVFAGLLLLVIIHNHPGNTAKHTAETPDTGYRQTEDGLRDYKQAVTVNITADGPSPQTLRVPNDTLISWRNQDGKQHQLAIAPGTKAPDGFYDFRIINPGDAYPFVIHQAGTYYYYDVATPTLTGVIIVGAI
jgi:plastocyanin